MAFVTTLLAIIGLALVLVVVAALLSKGQPPERDAHASPGTPPDEREPDDQAPTPPPAG